MAARRGVKVGEQAHAFPCTFVHAGWLRSIVMTGLPAADLRKLDYALVASRAGDPFVVPVGLEEVVTEARRFVRYVCFSHL